MRIFRQNYQVQRIPLFYLTTLSAFLVAMAWPFIGGISYFMFFALVPLLLVEDHIFRKGYRPRKVFFHAYWFFFLFNALTTWWIYFASFGGLILALVFNSLLMAIPFWFYHVTKRRTDGRIALAAYFLYWLAFEYAHYYWELSWPWLSFGNVFANDVWMIQWYEITGVAGGTFWILLVNLIIFYIIRDSFWLQKKRLAEQKLRWVILSISLLLPMLLSLNMYVSYQEKSDPVDVVVVQPNIDPYRDKFGGMSLDEQLEKFTNLAKPVMDEKVDYLLGPETQISFSVMENRIDSNFAVKQLRKFVSSYPKLRLITGMSSHRFIAEEENTSPTAKPTDEPGILYDHYNASLQISNNEPIQVYHKMKLVLGVERVPFAGIFPYLEKLALDMGGSSGSMGVESAPKLFHSIHEPRHQVVPAICYESIYGEHIAEFVNKGADLIFIITNDGWWRDTPGYRQHMAYARLRAIENRRSIARCANTGISCFINQRGDIIARTAWWEPAVLRQTINANAGLTWFSRHGDYIGRSAAFAAIMLALYALMRMVQGKTNRSGEV